jgi:23S rRNA pseudouridine1911/1915/1917 synthase
MNRPLPAWADATLDDGLEADAQETAEAAGRDGAALAAADPSADHPTDPPAEVRSVQVGAQAHGERLDKFLVGLAGEFSRSHLQQLIADGLVTVQGQVVLGASKRLTAGARVTVELRPTASSAAFRPEPMALDIVHEDEAILVVHKPAGLVVHPAPGNWSGTLLNGLLARDSHAARLPRAGIVHRLDKDTSGLMVVARTLQAQTALVRAIAAREVKREYLTLVHGMLDGPAFSVDKPMGRDPQSRIRMAVQAFGKPARTDVEPLAQAGGISALRCRLHTGRTHQIRVHLASIGHPLLADALYGGKPALGLQRQALHATRLGLAHPLDGRWLSWHAPLPDDLRAAWTTLCDEPAGV